MKSHDLISRGWMILIVVCASACSVGAASERGNVGRVSVAVAGIPSGVLCVSLAVGDAGGNFDVIPIAGATVFDIGPITSGNTSASGSAYDVACSSVVDSTRPTWIADPTPVVVRTGIPAKITLPFRRNQSGRVTTYFQESALQIAAGNNSTYAVVADGTVRAWGSNGWGALGDGTRMFRWTPTAVTGLSNVVSVAAGESHACALLGDGTIRCWGGNFVGEVGDGTKTTRLSPTGLPGLTGVVQIAAGGFTSCARLRDGTLKCWGNNAYGQIGDGTTTDRSVPTNVSSDFRFVDISVGLGHTCAVEQDSGGVLCWGNNISGQGGYGKTMALAKYPTVVTGAAPGSAGAGVRRVRAGGGHTCAERADDTLRCWGENSFGQIGDGTAVKRYTPVAIGLDSVDGVALGKSHTCTRLTLGIVRCWGLGETGALGGGTTVSQLSPTPVITLSGVAEVTAGENHTCARLENGGVLCWGANGNGQLGEGSFQARFAPTPVAL